MSETILRPEREGIYRGEEAIEAADAELAARREAGEENVPSLVRIGGTFQVGSMVYQGDPLDDGTRGPLAVRSDLLSVSRGGNHADRRAEKRGRKPGHAVRNPSRAWQQVMAARIGA
jgi:hypothetical protein